MLLNSYKLKLILVAITLLPLTGCGGGSNASSEDLNDSTIKEALVWDSGSWDQVKWR